MDALILKSVRCFASPPPIPLAPLTLLVGENSSGKSTFLAAVRYASQLSRAVDTPDFNEAPFLWGAYEQIANNRGNGKGRANQFTIGYVVNLSERSAEGKRDSPSNSVTVQAEFIPVDSQPTLHTWTIAAHDSRLTVSKRPDGSFEVTTESSNRVSVWRPSVDYVPTELESFRKFVHLDLFNEVSHRPGKEVSGDKFGAHAGEIVSKLIGLIVDSQQPVPYAFAPIRNSPRRTYEPTKDTHKPSGGHVPMVLANIYRGAEWLRMKEAIEQFGKASGLFQGLEIKKLGRQESSPFQILIKVAGPPSNLVDVGYGVSQALPIVFDLLEKPSGSMFLIQQPEVHLHPRAQAELGTLLGQLVKSDKKRFVIETHSDYLIDRVLMDIRDKKTLKPQDVAILYFERGATGVKIHRLGIDDAGNLINVPPGYRKFFLDEQRRFLGA